ncbi:MAG TPA: heme exporter protein CcmD [Nevskiaceae bacterium]|nr:heme exporter protein CcmD [Nevskiaceae bacterium]
MIERLAMGEYGFYVWASIGLSVAVFVWNAVAPWLSRRDVMERLASGEGEEGGE